MVTVHVLILFEAEAIAVEQRLSHSLRANSTHDVMTQAIPTHMRDLTLRRKLPGNDVTIFHAEFREYFGHEVCDGHLVEKEPQFSGLDMSRTWVRKRS